MSETPFRITRPDGRSNTQVLLDFVKGYEPGHVFTYENLIAAVSWSGRQFTTRDVQQLVQTSGPMLSRQESRVLKNVPQVGYKLALANEHVRMALQRRTKADVQLRRGLEILRNVKFDEMNENERMAHEGQYMVMEAIYRNTQALARRQSKTEELIANLTRRIDNVCETSVVRQ